MAAARHAKAVRRLDFKVGTGMVLERMRGLINRLFAASFILIILAWMVRQVQFAVEQGWVPPVHPSLVALVMYGTFMIGYSILVVGLLTELRRPTLSFALHRNWRWLACGAFLLGIFVLINTVQAIEMHDRPEFLKQWVLDSVCMESSSFSLLFGILFMTRSTPQRSPGYRLMLLGAALFVLINPFPAYITSALGFYLGGPEEYKHFWTETVPTLWFWWDFLSELVILVGALWLLRRGKKA